VKRTFKSCECEGSQALKLSQSFTVATAIAELIDPLGIGIGATGFDELSERLRATRLHGLSIPAERGGDSEGSLTDRRSLRDRAHQVS
jgi:hypothetical protein